jgi:hypothetical protein
MAKTPGFEPEIDKALADFAGRPLSLEDLDRLVECLPAMYQPNKSFDAFWEEVKKKLESLSPEERKPAQKALAHWMRTEGQYIFGL